jgi:2-phospho-L-lactate/phosphoenolpyruvate guanylyltransferase
MAGPRWTVLVPVKALPDAKSRLSGFSPDAEAHARLVRAMREDTMQAARDAPNVARVLRIGDRPSGDHDLVQRGRGLNAAVAEGALYARERWPDDAVAALVGDLPALTRAELADALDAAAGHRRAFVADSAGTGTTLLTAMPGTDLDPGFGTGSAARHARRAAALPAGPGLRHDVYTESDLRAALLLGVGASTQAAVAAAARSDVHPERAS